MLSKKLFLSSIVLFVLLSSPLVVLVEAEPSWVIWSQTYGGADDEIAYSLVETSDGGYAIAGFTGAITAGNRYFWLVKTDSDGNMQWNQTYKNTWLDTAFSLVETSDGGYALAGETKSYDVEGDLFLLVKTDAYGDMEWSQTFRESSVQTAYSLIQTSDGGYAMAGYIWPSDSKSSDFLLVKTDAYGNIEWNQTYNGGLLEMAYSLVETSDGGYALAGGSFSGVINSWLVKTDRFGNMEWNKTYAGENTVWEHELVLTSDGGFAIAGGGVLVKTDSSGNMEWNQTFGGESIVSLVQVSDGGYALAGYKHSIYTDSYDFWLTKTDANGNIEWNQTQGGENDDRAYSLVESSDGGYVLAGYTESFGNGKADFWLIKTDEYGNIPEFPLWAPLLAMLVVVMAVAVIYRRILSKPNGGRRG